MNARFLTLVAAVSMVSMTGCSGLGNSIFGGGAPCGPGCMASAAPAYDYAPGNYGGIGSDCGCGTDSYAGYNTGVIDNGYSGGTGSYNDYGYQGVPQPGQYSDGGIVVPQPQGNMVPAPTLPQPAN